MPVPGKIHFPGVDRIDILFLWIPLLLPIVLLTISSGWRGIHIASGTRIAAHLWHTWPLLRIGFMGGSANWILTGVQHLLLA